MTTKRQALWDFVGIYFNEDWPEDYGSEQASIDTFLADDPDRVEDLLGDIEWTLANHQTESELETYLVSQGSDYRPPSEEGGYRGWLTRVADHVRAAAGSGGSSTS